MVAEVKKIKTVVVGSSGMLGRDLCILLQQRGFIANTGLDLPELDITDLESVESSDILNNANVIFNCAAYTDVEKAEVDEKQATLINRDGVMNLCRVAENNKSVLVHVSTDFVFDGKSRMPYGEIDDRNPISAYGRSKLLGEIVLEHSKCHWILIRTAWLYGIYGSNFIKKIITHALKGNNINVIADEYGSPTYTADLAEAMIDLSLAGRKGPFHCVNSGEASRFELALEAIRMANINVFVRPVLEKEANVLFNFKAKRPKYSVLDNSCLERTIGISMRHWKEALVDYIGLLKDSGIILSQRNKGEKSN